MNLNDAILPLFFNPYFLLCTLLTKIPLVRGKCGASSFFLSKSFALWDPRTHNKNPGNPKVFGEKAMSILNDKVLEPLTQIDGISKTIAEALYRSGIKTPEDFAKVKDVKSLAKKVKAPANILSRSHKNAQELVKKKLANNVDLTDAKKADAPAKEAHAGKAQETSPKAEAVNKQAPEVKTDPISKPKAEKKDSPSQEVPEPKKVSTPEAKTPSKTPGAKSTPKTDKTPVSKPQSPSVPSPVLEGKDGKINPFILLEHLLLDKNARFFRETIEELRKTDLYKNIEARGVIYPLVACPSDVPDKFDILDGGRRFLIVKDLIAQGKKDWKGLYCEIRTDLSEEDKWVLSYELGKTTRQHSKMDEARFAHTLKTKFNLSDKEVGTRLNMGETQANKLVSLCRLPEPIQQMVHESVIGIEAAYQLSKLAFDVSFPRNQGVKAGESDDWGFTWQNEPENWKVKRLNHQQKLAAKIVEGEISIAKLKDRVDELIEQEKTERAQILELRKDAKENTAKVQTAYKQGKDAFEADKKTLADFLAMIKNTYGQVDPGLQLTFSQDDAGLSNVTVWTIDNAFGGYCIGDSKIITYEKHLEHLLQFSNLLDQEDDGTASRHFFRVDNDRHCSTCGRSIEGSKKDLQEVIQTISKQLKEWKENDKRVLKHAKEYKEIITNLKTHFGAMKAAQDELKRLEMQQKKAEELSQVSYQPSGEQAKSAAQ